MKPAARLAIGLVTAALGVGVALWWIEWPLATAPPPEAATRAEDGGNSTATRRERIEALEAAIAEQREALRAARADQDASAEALDSMRRELEAVRAEIEALERETRTEGGEP